MIPIDTYAALIFFCRTGTHPEYHILQLRRNTRKVPRGKKKKGNSGFEVVYVPGPKTVSIVPDDRNVDKDEEVMHRHIALHDGAGDRAISPAQRCRTLRPHRNRIEGNNWA